MKHARLLPPLLLATVLHANHRTITDVGGTVAPVTVNIAVSETAGGYLLTDAKKSAEEAKGVTYPAFTTYSTTYRPDATVPAIVNPFWWDSTKGNNYVERITTAGAGTDTPVVTAAGAYAIASTRYTNLTLLQDLVDTNRIPETKGYRIVAVSFDLPDEVHYYNGAYTTHVNDHLYFFAEKGPDDPKPVFLGSEYDDIYLYRKVVGFQRSTTIKAGRYTDTFTGNPVQGGYDYRRTAHSLNGRTAAEIFFYRPTGGSNLYQIRLGGIFNWSQRLDPRSGRITGGGFSGAGLEGAAEGVFVVDANDPGAPAPAEGEAGQDDSAIHDHGHVWDYIPNGGNPGVAAGSVITAAEKHYDSMLKYLDAIPEVRPH